ncbi:MAG: hypothetical protein H6706_05790 [Myxococcales bacterium]|nr:hypothetical protein [Myxococcales bacterium]
MLRSLGVICTLALSLWGCPPAEEGSLNGGVNNVDCPPGSECNWTCNGGVCNIDCLSDSVCDVTCNGGVCNVDCEAGATCDFRCNGGVCNFDCQDGADCSTGNGVRPRSDAGVSVEPDEGVSVLPEADAGAGGEGGGGGEGGAGGAGGHPAGPTTCGDLCAAMTAEAVTCTQTELGGRGFAIQSAQGCEDLLTLDACVACLQHLQVPDADCAGAAAACF